MAEIKNVSTENIYRLDGRVPILKAIPFGLQHSLAMFVSYPFCFSPSMIESVPGRSFL